MFTHGKSQRFITSGILLHVSPDHRAPRCMCMYAACMHVHTSSLNRSHLLPLIVPRAGFLCFKQAGSTEKKDRKGTAVLQTQHVTEELPASAINHRHQHHHRYCYYCTVHPITSNTPMVECVAQQFTASAQWLPCPPTAPSFLTWAQFL